MINANLKYPAEDETDLLLNILGEKVDKTASSFFINDMHLNLQNHKSFLHTQMYFVRYENSHLWTTIMSTNKCLPVDVVCEIHGIDI